MHASGSEPVSSFVARWFGWPRTVDASRARVSMSSPFTSWPSEMPGACRPSSCFGRLALVSIASGLCDTSFFCWSEASLDNRALQVGSLLSTLTCTMYMYQLTIIRPLPSLPCTAPLIFSYLQNFPLLLIRLARTAKSCREALHANIRY